MVLCGLAILGRRRFKYYYRVTKPLPLLSLLIYAIHTWITNKTETSLLVISNETWPTALLLICALFSGLVGDVLLLSRRAFLVGAAFFALGHFLYLLTIHHWPLWPTFLLVGVFSVGYYMRGFHVVEERQSESVTLLGMGYVFLLTFFVGAGDAAESAFDRFPFISFGAYLFYLSDLTLIWAQFIRPLKYGEEFILPSYFAAQILLTYGIIG